MNITIPKSSSPTKPGFWQPIPLFNETCTVQFPNFSRKRWPKDQKKFAHPLKAKFVLFETYFDNRILTEVPITLTRYELKGERSTIFGTVGSASDVIESRNLYQVPIPKAKEQTQDNDRPQWVPHWKYGRSNIRIRFVSEYRHYGALLQRQDGIKLHQFNSSTYRPLVYLDENSLEHSSQVELAPPGSDKPPVTLRIKLTAISPLMDTLNRQLFEALEIAQTMIPGGELDEIRYFLQDERLYRFILTQIISYIHMSLDYMAFRDEIRFYRGKRNLNEGVSTSSVLTKLACSVIIFLYLLDGGGTSWIVLTSLFGSCAVEAWKVWKILCPKLSLNFPFVVFTPLLSKKAQETARYDQIAVYNLGLILYPSLIGWSIYALKHYTYRSWYSWFISNLANAVYMFGFIAMCPQLYINYRLKTVAHLPWKVFMYKIFNTFVDDVFAWLIEMPWKHRIMTLRDDVIFLLLLVQVYMYRVDKSRTNEYGYAYDGEEDDGGGDCNGNNDNVKDNNDNNNVVLGEQEQGHKTDVVIEPKEETMMEEEPKNLQELVLQIKKNL